MLPFPLDIGHGGPVAAETALRTAQGDVPAVRADVSEEERYPLAFAAVGLGDRDNGQDAPRSPAEPSIALRRTPSQDNRLFARPFDKVLLDTLVFLDPSITLFL